MYNWRICQEGAKSDHGIVVALRILAQYLHKAKNISMVAINSKDQ